MYSLRQNIKKTIICLFIITTIFLPCVTKPKPSTQSFFFLKDINNFLITQGMKPLAYYGYDEKKSKIISEIFVYFSYISILAILYKLFFKKKKPENNSFISKLGEIHNIKKIENELNKKDQQQQQQNENKLYEHDQKTDLEKQQTENRLKKKKQIMQNYNNTQCNLLKNDTENLQLPVDDTYHLASQYFLANLPDHLFRKNQSSFINRFKKLQQQQDQNNQVEEQQKQQLDMFYKIFTIEKFQKIIENSSKISLETQLNSFVEFENINNFNMQDQQQFNTKNNILPDDLKQKKKTLETILKEFQELNNDNKEQIQQNLEKPQENFQNIQEDDLKKQSDEQSYDSIKKDVENLVERINTKIIEIFKNNNNKPNEEFIKLLTQYNNFYYQYMNDRSLLPDKEEEKIVKMFYIMFYMLKLKILDNYIGNDNIDLNAFCDNVESLLIQTQSLPNCFKTSETIVFLKNLKTKAEYIQYIDGLIEKRKNSAEESNKLKQYRKNIISNIDLEKNIIDIKEYAKELQKQDTIVLLKQLSTQWLKKEININEKNTIEGILETIISFAIEQLQREDGNCIFLMVLQDFFSKNTVLMEKEYSTYFKKIKYIIEFFKIINKYKNNLNNEEYIKQLKDIFKTIENTHNENEIEDSWNKILEKDNEINREILKNAQQEKENKIKNNNQFEEVLQSINFLKSVPSFNSKSLEKLDAFQILKDSQIDELQKSQLYSKQSIDFQNSMTDFNNIWGKKSNIFMNNDNVEKLQKSQIQKFKKQ